MRTRFLLLGAIALLALIPVVQSSAMSSPKLKGTVGPGFTITLKDKTGHKVSSLKPGKYTFVVSDKSSIHNFVVEKTAGGKFEKEITSVGGTGTKTKTISLTKGKWKVYCQPHQATMTQSFTVK